MVRTILSLLLVVLPSLLYAGTPAGYYRFPTIHQNTIVFTAEGDLWKVGIEGGAAERLTTHLGQETHAAISPDGSTVAFSAEYEGPTEVYTMPIDGGLPTRRTYDGERAIVVGWTPDGKILYSTRHYSTLPNTQLVEIDPETGSRTLVPLSQASEGVFDPSGKTLFFTRLPFQGSHTKRYRGGTVQNLWRFTSGDAEAVPLTADYPGTSKNPMWWKGRIYFASDRDGTMNLWSMNEDGRDLRQHTHHKGWDVTSPSLNQGRIVYQLGADLHVYDIEADRDRLVPITLLSDFDQRREKWVKKPMEYLSAAHLAPHGDRVVLTARGRVFVAPVRQGRFVEATRKQGVRYRNARFLADGKTLLLLSDESGEYEFWKVPANGVGEAQALSRNGKVFRFEGVPSPDGKRIAFTDKDQQLWILDIATRKQRRIAVSDRWNFSDLRWSPDSRWLAFVATADNLSSQIKLYRLTDGRTITLTSDRVDSYNPAWSPDGKWLYFLSDRHFESLVPSPWGPRQPEPFLDKTTKIYAVSLREGQRFPFQPADELHPGGKEQADKGKSAGEAKKATSPAPVTVAIDLEGIQSRTYEVPVPPGNYGDLSVNSTHLFWTDTETSIKRKRKLVRLKIDNKDVEPKALVEDIRGYELSLDGKKILVRKRDALYVIDAGGAAAKKLDKNKVNLAKWTFPIDPREEWRQMFVDAWRLERDYFYDRNLHGADWQGLLDKYLPLVERVADRQELNDLIAQLVAELSALHTFVVGGDFREGEDHINPASLGAVLARDQKAGGYRIQHIYRSDPNYIDRLSPLARPGVDIKEGDVILAINGMPTLSVPHPRVLLENQVGRQVLLRIKSMPSGKIHETVVTPISPRAEASLRYDDWELSRRLRVEKEGEGQIGYVHLRAMGGRNYSEWVRNFYPVFNRQGLIIDMRHNRGGNIDSWILEKLLRKAWFYWKPRVGKPFWNMQYAFRGHMVVITDEFTASDGEAFTEGFRRLGLGKVIGTRTWGGEIWLSFDNRLVDKGIASAAEMGVYGPEGKWLIEGHGVDPDIVVDNPPHATFQGQDAQLEAAIRYLQKQIREQPVPVPPPPPYPVKAVGSN